MKSRLPLRVLVLAAAIFAAPAPAAAQDPAPALAPGDMVRITVFRKPELSGEMEVGDGGNLLHPLYREVQVVGVPLPEVERRVRAFLTRYEAEPSFVVEPMVRVTVGGEVRTPGVQTVRPSFTTFQAVAQAGGTTDRGRMDRVLLYRAGAVRTLDLSNAVGGGGQERLRSGDVLVVQRRSTFARDYLAPIASLTAATAAVVGILLRN